MSFNPDDINGYSYNGISLKINNKEMNPTNIISFDILFSIDKVYYEGRLVYDDRNQYLETIPIQSDSIVEFSITDLYNEIYTYKFNIIKIDSVAGEQLNKGLILTLMDTAGFELMATYPEKGFTKTTISDIVKDPEILGDLMKEHNVSINTGNIDIKFDSFIFPLSKPLINGLNYLKRKSNAYVFRTRNSLEVNTLKEMISAEPKIQELFMNNTNNFKYRYKVWEYNIKKADSSKGKLAMTDYKVYSYNIMDKTNKPFDLTYEDSIKYLNEDAKNIQTYTSKGNKIYYKPYQNYQAELSNLYETSARELMNLKIIVLGESKLNVGDNIKIRLTGDVNNMEYNVEASGKWLIKKIKDNYTFKHFYQEIELIKISADEEYKGN